MGVKIAADGIMAELAEVKEERDYLLNQRVYNLEQRVAALTIMAEDGQKRTTAIEGKVSTIGKGEWTSPCRLPTPSPSPAISDRT